MIDNITKQNIKNSSIFLVLGTPSYFKDIPKSHVTYAKNIGKPFRVILHKNQQVPDWFKENVEDYKERHVDMGQTNFAKEDWFHDFVKPNENN